MKLVVAVVGVIWVKRVSLLGGLAGAETAPHYGFGLLRIWGLSGKVVSLWSVRRWHPILHGKLVEL